MAIELYIKYPVTLRLNLSSTTSAQNREEEKRGGPSIKMNKTETLCCWQIYLRYSINFSEKRKEKLKS